MKATLKINNKIVPNIAQDFTLSNELNETLDSGVIRAVNIPQLDVKPYDMAELEIRDEFMRYFEAEVSQEKILVSTIGGELGGGDDWAELNEVTGGVAPERFKRIYGKGVDGVLRNIFLGDETYMPEHRLHLMVEVIPANDPTPLWASFYAVRGQFELWEGGIIFKHTSREMHIFGRLVEQSGKYELKVMFDQDIRDDDEVRWFINDASLNDNTFDYNQYDIEKTITLPGIPYELLNNENNQLLISFDNEIKKYAFYSNGDDFVASYPNEQDLIFTDNETSFIDSREIKAWGQYEIVKNSPQGEIILKRFLIDSYQETYNKVTKRYDYLFNLMSETKGLETVQLSTITLTQPRKNSKKKSVWEYLNLYVNQYSPRIKVGEDGTWAYEKKYTLDKTLEGVFGKVYAPDFSLNEPNLRDVLSQLMITRDRIPVVKNNVITSLDLSARNGVFNASNLTDIQRSMDSQSYTQNLKRNYQDALSQDNSIRMVERLGFRNSDNALLTLDNMRVETRFPIYQINRILMGYYKRISIKKSSGGATTNGQMLVWQDITDLVLPNEKRNLLSQDYTKFPNNPTTVEELAQFKYGTVGYDLGNKYITGWGEMMSHPTWWGGTFNKSFVENILRAMDKLYPLGINSYNIIADSIKQGSIISPKYPSDNDWYKNIISVFSDDEDNATLKFKGLFFDVDYNGFYNGTLIHSKDDDFGDITINDNPSASLTLLEADGLFQKEKINRLGNALTALSGVYDTYNEIQPLGSVYGDDIVIFKQVVSYGRKIEVAYYGSKDYVLKNYFTSVFSKIRNTNLLSYNESIIRAENEKVYLFLSESNYYYEHNEAFSNFDSPEFLIMSAFRPSLITNSKNDFSFPDKINKGFFYKDGKAYLSDINRFVSGHSLAFNIQMYDNVSGGVYINKKESSNMVGSEQEWFLLVDDVETGFIENMGVYFCNFNDEYSTKPELYNKGKIINTYDKLFKLPQSSFSPNATKNLIGGVKEINLDNKEILDYTFQIEIITDSDDIVFTPKLLELSDLIGNIHKVEETYEVYDTSGNSITETVDVDYAGKLAGVNYAKITIHIPIASFSGINPLDTFIFDAHYSGTDSPNPLIFYIVNYIISGRRILEKNTSEVKLEISNYFIKRRVITQQETVHQEIQEINFTRTTDRDGSTYSFVAEIPPLETTSATQDENQVPSIISVSYAERVITTYNKNLFILQRNEPIKKHATQEEITESDIGVKWEKSNAKVSEVFSYYLEDTKPVLKIDFNVLDSFKDTIELWFYDEKSESYKLVFGYNVKDWQRYEAVIYLSLIKNGDFNVYDRNYRKIGKVKSLKRLDENDFTQKYIIIE